MEFALGKPYIPVDQGETTKTLGIALFKVLEGIADSWQIDQTELAAILHREPSTLSTWKKSKSVAVSKRPAPNDVQIFELIELFDSLSSMLLRKEDQRKWLRTESIEFGNKSPISLLKANSKNLFVLREYIDRVARP